MNAVQVAPWQHLSMVVLVSGLAVVGPWSSAPHGGAVRAVGWAAVHESRGRTTTAPPDAWAPQALLTAGDNVTGEYFADAVALSGNTALIGAINLFGGPGAAYVFVRSGNTWTQQAKLLPSDSQNGDLFGQSVALSGDSAIVGAIGTNAAYVFVRSDATWTQQAKLTPGGGGTYGNFGYSVALSWDTAVVGSYNENGPPYTGAAYVYVRTGTAWTQQALINDPVTGGSDAFAISVALRGNTALVGAPLTSPSGAAYVFGRSGAAWTEQARLVGSDRAVGDDFGNKVALNVDSALIAAQDKNHGTGAAYVFGRSGTAWTQQAELAPGGTSVGQFGLSAALSGDTALIGADVESGSIFNGAAFVFARHGPLWFRQARLMEPDGAVQNQFGLHLALSGDTTLIAGEDGENSTIGAAYVYVRGDAGSTTWPATVGRST